MRTVLFVMDRLPLPSYSIKCCLCCWHTEDMPCRIVVSTENPKKKRAFFSLLRRRRCRRRCNVMSLVLSLLLSLPFMQCIRICFACIGANFHIHTHDITSHSFIPCFVFIILVRVSSLMLWAILRIDLFASLHASICGWIMRFKHVLFRLNLN